MITIEQIMEQVSDLFDVSILNCTELETVAIERVKLISMIEQYRKEAIETNSRIDIIGQNGNTGEHYKYNCRKRAYYGEAVQWDSTNFDQIKILMADWDVRLWHSKQLVVRKELQLFTIEVGDWVVKGENGMVKRYSEEQFNIKYERI